MPNTQSRAPRGRSSRSNRGPRAGKSGSNPRGKRTTRSRTRRRNQTTRRGNAASQPRRRRAASTTTRQRIGARRLSRVGGGKSGRGSGRGGRSLRQSGRRPNRASEGDREVVEPGGTRVRRIQQGQDITASRNPVRRRRSVERRTRRQDPLVVGRPD